MLKTAILLFLISSISFAENVKFHAKFKCICQTYVKESKEKKLEVLPVAIHDFYPDQLLLLSESTIKYMLSSKLKYKLDTFENWIVHAQLAQSVFDMPKKDIEVFQPAAKSCSKIGARTYSFFNCVAMLEVSTSRDDLQGTRPKRRAISISRDAYKYGFGISLTDLLNE